MDTLLVVLFVVVIFAIFVCLENSGFLEKNNAQLIEGLTSAEEYLLEQSRNLSSQGVCTDSSGGTIWPRDEQTCTGMTGFQLEFVTQQDKQTTLSNIGTNIPTDVMEREISLQYGDIVEIGDRDELFIYRGVADINLDTHPEEGVGEHIALFPYVHQLQGNDKLEYCYADDGTPPASDQDISDASTCQGTFFTPVLEPGLDLTAVSDDLKSTSCQDDGNGIYRTPAGLECFTKDQIKISHCVETEIQGDQPVPINIKPVAFWKSQYPIGSNKQINEICEGTQTGNTWNYNSNLNTMMDSQTFAEIASQVDQNVQQLNNDATTAFNDLQPGGVNTYILPTQQAELLQQQETARAAYLQTDCNFESASLPYYHGNVATGTANLYVCNGNIGALDDVATAPANIADNCQSNNLVCDPNFAKDDSSGLVKQIQCVNNQFTYMGCEPDTCTLPPDFDDTYEIRLPSGSGMIAARAGDTVNINALKDMVTNTSYVSCKNGYNGDPIIRSCSNDVLVIEGCSVNTCVLPNDITGYHVSQQPTSSESLDSLYTNNNMKKNYTEATTDAADASGLDFRCSGPNYYHLGDIAVNPDPDQTFDDFMINVNDTGKNLKDYSMYPKARCNTDSSADVANYEFTLSGCQPNQCQNPALAQNQKIYDGSQKPEHMADKEDIVISGNGIYEKYEYNSALSSTSSTFPVSDMSGVFKCGRNYQKDGVDGSTDTHDKVISEDKIKCYNFYDYDSLSDISNTYSPPYKKDENAPDASVPNTMDDLSGWLTSNPANQTNRVLPFSVGGCLENYCTWPTLGGTQDTYDKPRIRDPTTSGIDQLILDSIQDSNGRYQLGYNYDSTTTLPSTDIDYTTRKTAKEYVDYNESDKSVKIKCVGESDQVCEAEEPYTIDEIDDMVLGVDDALLRTGQNGSFDNTHNDNVISNLSQTGRGGQFAVKRCWNSVSATAVPEVTCQGSDDCSNSTSSTCEASVSGCQQNKCNISEPDADGGTRVLIEKMDTTGQLIHISVGGINRENIGESFNVDQIRNITCDFNHSKPVSGTDPPSYGGGGGVEDIVIECENNDSTFTITNKCGLTDCVNTIDKIDGLINLKNHLGDENTICPNQSWIESHDSFYNGTNSFPPNTTPLGSLPDISSNAHCDIQTSNQDLFDFNVNRYKLNGNEYECYNGVGDPDNISSNLPTASLSSVGVATNSCNYSPDGSFVTKRTVSGCQPKLCSLPPIATGFNYHPSLIPGQPYSTEGLLLRDYYSGVKPDYLNDDDYNTLTFDQDLITCSTGWSGSVDLSCSQIESDYHVGTYPNMGVTGCIENKCTIPSPLDSSITLSSTFSQTQEHTVQELIQGINCENNHSVNSGYQISCDTQGDTFTGLDTYCSSNRCLVPSSIDVHDANDDKYINRERFRDPSNILDNNLPNVLVQDNALKNEIFGYVVPQSDHNICYHEDIRNISSEGVAVSDISNVSCNNELCTGNPILVCGTTPDPANTDPSSLPPFEISGCYEKYCSLPSLSQNNILYSFGGVRNKLELVSEMNGLTDTGLNPSPGLTKEQVNRVFSQANKSIECATFAEPQELTDSSGAVVLENGVPVLMTPSIECSTDGADFILSGCRALQPPSQTHTNGEIVYSYYPSGCSIAKQNAFIYLSGTDELAGGGTNTTGRSVTHSFARDDPLIPDGSSETDFYYYKNSAVTTTDDPNPEPIHNYSSESPVLSNGIWSDSGDATANENWYKVPMILKFSPLGPTQINQNMKDFMDVNKDMCDKISSCEGFNITRFNRLTSEIDAIEKYTKINTNARNPDGTVDRVALSDFLIDTTNEFSFLEYGTMKGEQKGQECNSQMDVTVVGFHDNWGNTTGVGGNSYVYNSAIIGGVSQDVLNHNIVPNNSALYFKKNTLSTAVNDPLMGYTNNDLPNTVIDTTP